MDRKFSGIGVLITLVAVCGCGDTAEKQTAGSSSAEPEVTQLAHSSNDQDAPILETTRGFLQAVIDGDTERALAQLTPQAVEQILSSGKAFSPPGLETADFRLGEVRKVSDSQAFVQCYLSDSAAGKATQEEMCCVVKSLNGEWRISGIAFQIAPNKPPYILDFEKPPRVPVQQQQMAGQSPQSPQGANSQTPYTAQQPAASNAR